MKIARASGFSLIVLRMDSTLIPFAIPSSSLIFGSIKTGIAPEIIKALIADL